MEDLMLHYFADDEMGANAHPLKIQPDDLKNAVLDWCKATGSAIPDMEELGNYLLQDGNWYRFAPAWLRACSAQSRTPECNKYIAIPGQPHTGEEAASINDDDLARKLRGIPDFRICWARRFEDAGTSMQLQRCLMSIMVHDRYPIQEFTCPRRLLANMRGIHRLGLWTGIQLDDTIEPQELARKCMHSNWLDPSDDPHTVLALRECLEMDAVLFCRSLPWWIYTIVSEARRTNMQESLHTLVRLVYKSDDPDVRADRADALKILRKLLKENKGILQVGSHGNEWW
jgi:hypothetical protein